MVYKRGGDLSNFVPADGDPVFAFILAEATDLVRLLPAFEVLLSWLRLGVLLFLLGVLLPL